MGVVIYMLVYLIGFVIAYRSIRDKQKGVRSTWHEIGGYIAYASASWMLLLVLGLGYSVHLISKIKLPQPPKWL